MPPREVCSFSVGASQLGDTTSEWRCLNALPEWKSIIKQESKTLVGRVDLPGADSGVLKLYRRRGMLNRVRGGVLPFRVQREYAGLCSLAKAGVSCSLPLLWGWGFAEAHGHFELLLTREIPGAVSLKQHLAEIESPLPPTDWLPLFDAFRRMHDQGVYHGALWPKNVLVTRDAQGKRQFYLIDLARALLFPGSIRGTSMARFDLLSLLYSLRRADAGFEAESPLRHYGYSPSEAQAIAEQARHYRSSRHLRNRLTLLFQLRALLARRC